MKKAPLVCYCDKIRVCVIRYESSTTIFINIYIFHELTSLA